MRIKSLATWGPSIAVVALIVIGAALRVGGLFGPLTHDELSAICRLRFGTLADVLTYGVRYGDTHPAGVQVFLWCWTQLFGKSAIAIRLPFMLMGVATIPLIYGIGRRWYGRWSALLPAAVMAVCQYTVYYSDIARMYGFGLFFILSALYVLTRMVSEQRYTVWRLALFALLEACCAYTQYFCSLTALLMAVAALFFVGRRHLLPYLASCLGAVLLFLPHLGITLYQLTELKGIGGWLGAPTPLFAVDFLRYLTHYSYAAAVVSVVAFALLFSVQSVRKNLPLLVASLVVGLLPGIIGYFYSVAVNPVLQFSVLIFSFPFLLLALAACVDDRRHRWHAVLTAVYVVTMVVTLFVCRHHYTMLGKEWIEASAKEAQTAVQDYGDDQVICLFNISPHIMAYYDSTLCLLPQELVFDAARLDSTLARCPKSYLVCSGVQDPVMLALVNRHYPFLLRVHPCVSSEICLFSRQPSAEALCVDSLASFILERPLQPSAGEFYTLLDTTLADIMDDRYACVESFVSFCDTAVEEEKRPLFLVTELVCRGRQLDWRGMPLDAEMTDSLYSVLSPVRIESTVKHRGQMKHTRLKIYLWNPDCNVRSIPYCCRIRLFPTSPWMYSVLEEI